MASVFLMPLDLPPLSFIFTLIFCYANLVGCLLIKFEADYVVLILLIHFCIMLKCELWRIGRIDKFNS